MFCKGKTDFSIVQIKIAFFENFFFLQRTIKFSRLLSEPLSLICGCKDTDIPQHKPNIFTTFFSKNLHPAQKHLKNNYLNPQKNPAPRPNYNVLQRHHYLAGHCNFVLRLYQATATPTVKVLNSKPFSAFTGEVGVYRAKIPKSCH